MAGQYAQSHADQSSALAAKINGASRVTVPGEEEEPEEEPLRSRVTVPGEEEEESEDDGQILNKNGKLGSKKRGKN